MTHLLCNKEFIASNGYGGNLQPTSLANPSPNWVIYDCINNFTKLLGDDDAIFISWMAVKKGPPQRCDCGLWFKLTEGSSVKFDL